MIWSTFFSYFVVLVLVISPGSLSSPIPGRLNLFNNIITKTDEVNDSILPIVNITQGLVVGSVAVDGNYFEFNGIPYADSTSGLHRFKAPMPPPSFEDTFIANRKDIKCVRALGTGYEGTEDCLVANVYTPTLNTTSQLPVMVWVKGKEFDRPDVPELSFKKFVEKDVVMVSLNYRESVLGFLCLGTEAAPGNAGLKDIIAGLEWTKRNIEQFGGNPDDITLFGHGSGAAAVDLITISPMANGLVNKAIAQSGTAMAPWAVSRDNLEYAVQVAEALGHVVTDIQELSQVFTRSSVAALMGVINELDLTENSLAFAPCVERQDLEGVTPFLVKTPSESIADSDFLKIPFITGFVDNEGTLRAEEALAQNWLERMEDSFYKFLQPDLKFQNETERIAIAERIRRFYFEDDQIDISSFNDYIAYHGETMILVSSIREARARAQASSAPTYLYQFSYRGNLGEPFTGPFQVDTAAHSEELSYMFYDNSGQASERDLVIAEILVERWTNFAKNGDPSSLVSPAIWHPFTITNPYYLWILASDDIINVGTQLEMSLQNPHTETITFWNEIYEEHFLDAESNWSLTDRNENEDLIDDNGDDDNSDVDTEQDINEGDENLDVDDNPEVDENPEVDQNPEVDENPDGEEDVSEEDDDGNSASTAVGYTFLIVTLFSLLNHFHSLQLVS